MNQLTTLVEYLKDPELVANFQKKFGIRSDFSEQVNTGESNTFISSSTDIDCESNSKKALKDKVTKNNQNNEKYLSGDGEITTKRNKKTNKNFTVENKFWYYFFFIGTYFGDEIFYSIYFPFWFWNLNYDVARRIITLWAVVMYIGQSFKDVIKWPRPACPPAVRVQNKWSLEYGMPSTHAMIAVAIPLGTIFFTEDKYTYPVSLAATLGLLMCVWVCTSRIYLGMHTVLDVLVGVLLALLLFVITAPLLISFDKYMVSWHWTPVVILAVTISLVIFYPSCDKWTPTRGDTTTVLGCIAGIYIGACIIYHVQREGRVPEPYEISYLRSWPKFRSVGIYLARFLIGITIIILMEILLATATYTCDRILRLDPKESRLQRKQRLPALDLTYKYITYCILGFTVAIVPLYLILEFNITSLLVPS